MGGPSSEVESMAEFFGTNGVRGLMDRMNPPFISKLVASFATWMGKDRVLVGRDTRKTGEMVEAAVVSGLLWSGTKPVLTGILPTPALEYLSAELHTPAIVITSSHNPPEWIALKFLDERGVALSKERGEEIERIYKSEGWRVCEWKDIPPVERMDNAKERYMDRLRKAVGSLDGLSVVIDAGHGTASTIAPPLFREKGARVVEINCDENGLFPNRWPEPTEANVKELMEKVVEEGADIGIAYDGDADRLALVDEKGRYVLGDKVFALAVDIALSERDGDVVTTVATSDVIREVAKRHGRKVVYVKVGSPYIAEEMERGNYATGGEEVGGIVWPNVHMGKDGILSSLKIAERLTKEGVRLSQLVDALPRFENVKVKIPCGSERFDVIRRLQERFKDDERAITVDGVRINSDRGWVIARASGTENYIRIFAEAKTRDEAARLVEEMKGELESVGLKVEDIQRVF